MKKPATFTLAPNTLALVKARAFGVGVSMSTLLDVVLSRALATVSDENLRAMVHAHRDSQLSASQAPTGPVLTRKEVCLLNAYDTLALRQADIDGNRFFTLRELAKASGFYPSTAVLPLRGLQDKGLLKCIYARELALVRQGLENIPEVEHWARPSLEVARLVEEQRARDTQPS